MASACGIHIDQRRYHLVALDGSVKKHKVTAALSGEIPPDEDPVTAVATALRRAAKQKKIKASETRLVIDSGLAAFRNLTLPFDDKSKIEEVIKFEIESDLPQWDIDEVVVDPILLSSKPGVESNLLVTALPKARLELQIAACEQGGMEPMEAELDGTALFEAAHAAGFLAEDTAQVLVHVGDSSTTVVVADGGRLSSIRAIRAGANPLPTFEETEEVEGEEPEEGEDGPSLEEIEADAARRLQQTAQRIRRELGRTLSGARTTHDIEAIYVCGHPLPGLVQDELFDTPVRPLEAFPNEEQSRSSDLVIAYGAALHGLGGATALSPHLRREELRYAGKFERLELPLAFFAVLLFFFLVVQLFVIEKQIAWRDEGGVEANQNFLTKVLNPIQGDMQLWLEASNRYVFPDEDDPRRVVRLPRPLEDTYDYKGLYEYAKRAEQGADKDRTKFQEIQKIHRELIIRVDKLKRELGQVTDTKLPQSALEASTLVMESLAHLKGSLGMRFGIRGFRATYQLGRGQDGDSVEILLDMDFFADNSSTATLHYNEMELYLRDQPWCRDFQGRKTTPHDDGGGISADRLKVVIDLEQAEEAGEQA